MSSTAFDLLPLAAELMHKTTLDSKAALLDEHNFLAKAAAEMMAGSTIETIADALMLDSKELHAILNLTAIGRIRMRAAHLAGMEVTGLLKIKDSLDSGAFLSKEQKAQADLSLQVVKMANEIDTYLHKVESGDTGEGQVIINNNVIIGKEKPKEVSEEMGLVIDLLEEEDSTWA